MYPTEHKINIYSLFSPPVYGIILSQSNGQLPIPSLLDVSRFVIHDENFVHLGKGTYLRDISYHFDDQDKIPKYPDNFKVSADYLCILQIGRRVLPDMKHNLDKTKRQPITGCLSSYIQL